MSYEPEPAPELSELEDRHQLQQHAHSIGYVAVPEAFLEACMDALRLGSDNLWTAGHNATARVLDQQIGEWEHLKEVIARERR